MKRRSGVVLLIVIAMLALFAVVGLSFVFYAESSAEAARSRRQAETVDLFDVTPEKLFSYALGQLIFDTDNPKSAMHGHSLGRSMYGSTGGTVPFNGLGRPHPDTEQTLPGLIPFDGINVPYTFPDINNPFLACLDPDNPGRLKERSFFRNGSSLRPSSLPALPNGEGDVRNVDSLDGTTSPANPAVKLYNDAFWMDLDFPIMTAKDGTRYKPLFAFTVLDLDGRLNLAVSGNYQADYTKIGGTSRCGLGTWEINPARVLTIDKSEIANLFRNANETRSRYGADNEPDTAIGFPDTRRYSRIDYSGLSTQTIARATKPFSHFSTSNDWKDIGSNALFIDTGDRYPTAKVAAGYDYFASRSPTTLAQDLKMAPSNTEAIFRWRDRGAHALTSDLIRLLPNNLNPQSPGSAQIFNRITPYSMSLDTSHLAPFLASTKGSTFQWNEGEPFPKSTTAMQTPPQSLAAGAGEFSIDFRSQTAAHLPRLNLNRYDGTPSWEEDVALAQEIFHRLVRITGALPPPGRELQPADLVDPQYKARRWLAQLAVNIVDSTDLGNHMTMLLWNPHSNPTAADYVFGVELPRLLINEAYASVDNDPSDPHGAKYRVNTWAELHNPITIDHSSFESADLQGGPVYRLLLAQNTDGIADSPTGMPKNLYYEANDPNSGVSAWMGSTVRPGGGLESGTGGKGFYLVAPAGGFVDGRRPAFTRLFSDSALKWDTQSSGMQSGLKDMPLEYKTLSNLKATLVLQRLARLGYSANNDPADPSTYNPYVTVDVFPDIPVNNSVRFFRTTDMTPPALDSFQSVGRYQPMQATDVRPQILSKTPNEPRNTFSRQNFRSFMLPADNSDTLKSRFDTIYFFDRSLVSTAELLHVHAVPPWEVTQRFGTKEPLTAYAAFQNDALLHRFLETVTTGARSYNSQLAPYYRKTVGGLAMGTGVPAILVPGKINLNTVADEKIIEALFDRQSNSIFTDQDVHQFWLDLLDVRKTRPIAGFSDYTFDRNSRTVTMHNTLIGKLFKKMYDRAAKDGANEFEATEGLRKVMNNITFTSNAFAAWVTAGFFEVDAAGNPIQEIGKNENRHVRHHMFAVVDRSQLVVPTPAQLQSFTTMTSASAKGATNATLAASSGFLRSQDPTVKVDFAWQIKPGMALTINRDFSIQETVLVQGVNGDQIQFSGAGFVHPHLAGGPVDLAGIQGPQVPLNRAPDGTTVPNFMLGYPGPQPQFNLREYSYVVPYYNIID